MRPRALARAAALLLFAAVPAPAQEAEPPPPAPAAPLVYDLGYDVRLSPNDRSARVTVRIRSDRHLVKKVRFAIDPERHVAFRGDGGIESGARSVLWEPPAAGGALHFTFRIDHLRDAKSYDAHATSSYAIFRGDDLVPPARVRAEKGAEARARLRLRLPDGWRAALPYDRLPDGRYAVEHPGRRFDRPVGWIALGRLAVLRERVAGSRVAVAAPAGQRVRRQDVLALLRFTLPWLRKIVDPLPERLLVVGAGDPMWRGGLSGPRSVFVHADRPLLENDLTSPVLHELLHAVLGLGAGPGGDWVVEGLAELYSLELLARSKTISKARHRRALARLAERGAAVAALDVDPAVGPVAARAASALHALDGELRAGSGGSVSLDDVVARLASERGLVTSERFRRTVDEVAGRSLGAFFRARVPLRQQPAIP